MAAETINANIGITAGNLRASGSFSVTSGSNPTDLTTVTQQCSGGGASGVLLDKGNVGTVGWCYIENTHATLSVQVSLNGTGGTYSITIPAGEFIFVTTPVGDIAIKEATDTATVFAAFVEA